MAKTPVDYSIERADGVRVLVHSASNYVGDIEKAAKLSGLDLATVRSIDAIR